jgi:RimJ/RimL family protein N-acetyltransferase
MVLHTTNPNIIIQGNSVLLRLKTNDDLLDDYRWRRDSELSKYDAVPTLTISFNEFVERYHIEFFNQSERRIFSIDSIVNDRHIGNIMFYSFDRRKKSVELGITIGEKDYWNKGYGTESVELFVRYLFEDLGMKSIYLHTLKWNERAKNAFLKSGFKEIKNIRRLGYSFIKMEINR